MFSKIKNERGAALVIVLLTIALIMLFSTVMMNSILTNAKQNNITEQNYRSTHLAEMGAKFIRDQVLEYMSENDFEMTDEYFANMQSYVETEVGNVTVDAEAPERSFEITEDFTYEENERGALLLTEVTGHDQDISKSISVTLQLISGEESVDDWLDDWLDDSEEFPDPPEDADDVYEGDKVFDAKGNNACPTSNEERSNYIKGNGYVKCTQEVLDYYSEGLTSVEQPKGSLNINGTGVFNEVFITAKTSLTVKKNAYINSSLTSENNPNSVFLVCGNARFKEGINYKGAFSVRGYVISDEHVYFENTQANIGRDTILKNGLDLHNASLNVGGNLTVYTSKTNISTFGGTINVTGNVTIYEEGQSEPIVNPDWPSINYTDSGPEFPGCEGIDFPDSGSGGDPSVDLDNAEY